MLATVCLAQGEVLSIILVNGERLQSHHSVLHGNTCDPSVTFRVRIFYFASNSQWEPQPDSVCVYVCLVRQIGRTMLSSRQLKHTVKPVWNQQFDFFPLQEASSRAR